MTVRKLALCALTVTALLGSGGVAAAKSYHAKSPIEYYVGAGGCGKTGNQPVIGTSSYVRKGNVVSVSYKLKGAEPNISYHVELWRVGGIDAACESLGSIGRFKTNRRGDGKAKGSIGVPAAATEFFAAGVAEETIIGSYYDDALAVTLP